MDLVDCDDITDVGILKELNKRFQAKDIYSSIGPIIIALNPYCSIPRLYEGSVLNKYSDVSTESIERTKFGRDGKPHVWMVPFAAYQQLMLARTQQAIVISGESGAGKTETTKLCLQLLSHIASEQNRSEASSDRIEDKVLATNPVLESFGNAKTARNNNSSRFGKWLEVTYSLEPEHSHPLLRGARITPYLLEKSRVIQHASDERNYHIFYQVCANGVLDLQPAASYRYLRFSKSMKIPGVDDKKDFEETCQSMIKLGFSDRDRDTIFEIIKAILLCGNLMFTENKDIEGSPAMVSTDYLALLRQISTLMGVDEFNLQHALISRSMTLRGERTIVQFTVAQAQDAVNALAKEMYGRMFSFIVNKSNITLGGESTSSLHLGSMTSIGLLDIFGFEKFKNNSFEQLCINYANEKLQQYFIGFVLKKEQELYTSENVSFDTVAPIDNVDVLMLLETKKDGIFSRLDDEIKIPKASDETFLKKVTNDYNNTKIANRRFVKDVKMGALQFEIRHFAGAIRYDAQGFMEKNRDKLYDDLEELLVSSSRQRFREIMTNNSKVESDDQESSGSSAAAASTSSNATTISSRFQFQLQQLVTVLQNSQPHFIKCIKPNNNKQELQFDEEIVLTQLQYSGILEAIQVRKSGFPIRRSHDSFWKAYWCLWKGKQRKQFVRIPEESRCTELLAHLNLKDDMIRLGKTLAFCKSEAISALENAKLLLKEKCIITLQSSARRFLAMRRARILREIQQNLLTQCEYGMQHSRSNIGVIDGLKAAIDASIQAGVSKKHIHEAEMLLVRLLQVKDCLDKLDRFIHKNVEVDADLPILDEYKELSELANSAVALCIQSPILSSVQERLSLIKERAEAVVALNQSVEIGDEDDIRVAIERVQRLICTHKDEEFCKEELTNAVNALRFVSEDFVRMEKAVNLVGAWMKFLDHKISKATESSKKKNSNIAASLSEQILSFNTSLVTTMNEYAERHIVSKAVRLLMDTILKFEYLHRNWMNRCWTETFEAVRWILDQCESDFVSIVRDPRKRQILATNWNIIKGLMDLEMKLIEQDLVQNFILPKFVDRIRSGGVIGSSVDTIDIESVDYELFGNDIAEAKNYTFMQNALDPVLQVVESHLELRGLFIDGRWEKIIHYAETTTQNASRRSKIAAWLQNVKNRDTYDESFIGDVENFVGNSEANPTYWQTKKSNDDKLNVLYAAIEEELTIVLYKAVDSFIQKVIRNVMVAENVDDLCSKDNRSDFENYELLFQLVQDIATIYRASGDLPTMSTNGLLEGVKQVMTWRKAILNGNEEIIFNFDTSTNNFFNASFATDNTNELLKEQLTTAYAKGCALHIEKGMSQFLTQQAVIFPMTSDVKHLGLQSVDQIYTLLQDCEARAAYLDSIGHLELQTQRLIQLTKVLSGARRQYFMNNRNQMKPYLKDFQEMLDECTHVASVSDAMEYLQNEIKAMKMTAEYSEKMIALEEALQAGQPVRYFVPYIESVNSDNLQSPGNNSNTPHSRLKSMSSEFDLMSSATSLAVKDILKDENLMINDEEIDYRDLSSMLNMTKEFQEDIEAEGGEIPDDMILLLEAAELIAAIRKNIVTMDFIVAMKSVQSLLSKGLHRRISAVDKEIDHNLYELSNSAIVVVCMTAIAHGKPTGPIGLFDYKSIVTNTLEDTIEMAQCFELHSPRVKALFDAVVILTDLRKAQKLGDWKGVAEILDKASAQKIGRGYSEICFEEISRASVEKDNNECIQAIRVALINEEIGCADGFIDRDNVVSKELVAALSKSAALPEDTRGPILKGIFQLAEAVLKMRKAAKDSEDYLNELVSIVADALDNFRNDLDGMARPGTLQRKASSVRTMRNTLIPRSKVSYLDTSASPGASILGIKSPSQGLRKTSQDEFSDLVFTVKRELELIKHHHDLLELEGEINTALEANGVELDEEGNINKANINLETLKDVMAKAEELDSSRLSLSKHLKELKEIGDVVYEIRYAVFHDQWDTMSATLENTVGGEQGLHWPEYTRREISIARSEVENRWIITNLTNALQKDRLHGELGEVPLGEVSNRDLIGYISTAKTLKPRTEEAVRLLAAAERICAVRGLITIREINPDKFTAAVNAIDWQNVKRMAKEILLDVQQRKCHPIVGSEARLIAEFAEDRMICFAMEQALLTGGVKGRPGRLDLSSLSTKELDRAYQQALRSSIKTENAKILVVVCRIMLKLRETIRRAETAPKFEDAVEAWATIKVLLTEVDAQQKVESELNCWELCDEEIDLIQRHSVVQDLKTSLIESSIEASHIYNERHVFVAQDDLSTLDIGTSELRALNNELEKMVSASRDVSFQSDNLSEFVACATSLRMYRSHVIDQQWKDLEKLMQDKTLRSHLNLIKQVKSEFSWITCELHNNMAISLLRKALLGENIPTLSLVAADGAENKDDGWNLELLKAGSYSERNAQLYAVMEEVRQFKITSNIAKAWFDICDNMYQLRTSLEHRDNANVAKCLRWFKSNGRICPQSVKVEAQRAYELHQNDLLLHGLLQALSEGKPSGKRGEMDVSTIDVAAIESLLAQADGIHPKIAEVARLLSAASTILQIRKSLLAGDMIRLQNIMDELSYEDSIPLEIIEEVAVARAELDNRTAIQSMIEALSSFEDTDSKKVDFTFLSATSANSFGRGDGAADGLSSPIFSVRTTETLATESSPSPGKAEFDSRRKSMGMSILESFNNRRYSFANRSSSNIDPETIDTDILEKGMRLAKLHGIFSERASRLFRTVDLVRSLRLAMKRFDWAEVETIMEGSKFEENIGTRYDELASREIQAICSQLDVRAAIVDLSKALKVGWAKCSHGLVDTSDMRNDMLEEAIERAERSIHDLNIADVPTTALVKSNATKVSGGKKRVTFRDEVEEKDQQLKHQQSVSDQLTLLMRSARKVLQIRELLAVGNMEEAGSMAEDALTFSVLHYTVVEELRLYAKEINTALVSMRTAENLRLIAVEGRLQPLQAAIQDALSSDIHLGTDLGIICTLTRANSYFMLLQSVKEQLLNMQQENNSSVVEDVLNTAENVHYGDEELEQVRRRLTSLQQFEAKCHMVDDVWTYLSDERMLFRRLLQYAHDWKVASHPYSIRLNLYLKLSSNSLRTVKFMQAMRHDSIYALISHSMRYKQQYLDLPSSTQRYRLEMYPQLRRPEDFALRMTVVSEDLKKNMLLYSDQPLPTSLTKLPPPWASLATFVFTGCIRGLEKNFFTHMDVMLAQLINLGRRCTQLRDEIYLQLIKQMRNNPDPNDISRLWRICLVCLYYFPCSLAFENYLEFYFKQVAEEEFRQYRYARRAIRYLHRSIFYFGYDRLLPVIDKDQRHELRRWLVDPNHDAFLPDKIKERMPLPKLSSSSKAASSSSSSASTAGASPDASAHAKAAAGTSSNLALMSLEQIVAEDLQQDPVFTRTPSAPVAAPTPVHTITGLLGLQIPAQNAALGIHSTAARLVGSAVAASSPHGNASTTPPSLSSSSSSSSSSTSSATTTTTTSATGDTSLLLGISIRGVRENWIHRFRCFNHPTTSKEGGYMTRQKFAAVLASTMTGGGSKGSGPSMDQIDRDVFYFLLLGKKMPYRSAIVREYGEDRQVFHFTSDEEAANSALRRQWLEKHIPVSDFSSELFFSQMQSSDFLVYAERFWDRVILKMSRECLHFPFLHWDREGNGGDGTASPSSAIATASAIHGKDEPSGTTSPVPSLTHGSGNRRRSVAGSTASSSSSSSSSHRRSSSGSGNNNNNNPTTHASSSSSSASASASASVSSSANHKRTSVTVDISISWELYREIVLTGMKKYLQQFHAAPGSSAAVASGGKVAAAKTLLRVAVKKVGVAALLRRKSLTSDDAAAAATLLGGDPTHGDSMHSFSGQQLLKKKHHKHGNSNNSNSNKHGTHVGVGGGSSNNRGRKMMATSSSSQVVKMSSPIGVGVGVGGGGQMSDEDDNNNSGEEDSVQTLTLESGSGGGL